MIKAEGIRDFGEKSPKFFQVFRVESFEKEHSASSFFSVAIQSCMEVTAVCWQHCTWIGLLLMAVQCCEKLLCIRSRNSCDLTLFAKTTFSPLNGHFSPFMI